MANTQAPFGFREASMTDGISSNFGVATGQMLYSAAATFFGDPLIQTAGYLSVATVTGNTGAAISGHAVSFEWNSVSQKKKVWNTYWPGNDCASTDVVTVRYDLNPQTTLLCQANAGPVTQASVNSYANFATGSGGSTLNGLSSFSLDVASINATKGSLPYKIVGLVQGPITDPTSAYNLVSVQVANFQ